MKLPRGPVMALAGSTVGAALGYRYFLSPRIQTWGATPEEVLRPMPGDELVPKPMMHGTHAVTIDAPPQDIWPWLLQIGYGRAGFYSYERLERLMGLRAIKNADTILREFQHLAPGDIVPFAPGTNAGLRVMAIEPDRYLSLGTRDSNAAVVWSFGLYRIDDRHTRLVSRNLAYMPAWTVSGILTHPSRWRVELPMKLFMNLGGFMMVRKMLLGIKRRAERLASEEVTAEAALALSSGCE